MTGIIAVNLKNHSKPGSWECIDYRNSERNVKSGYSGITTASSESQS